MGNIDTSSPEHILPLTFAQVEANFPQELQVARADFELNVKISKEEGDWDPEEPGILPPELCRWYLDRDEGNTSLPNFPGFRLHMYDEESIASYHGGGSDMVWNGFEWDL